LVPESISTQIAELRAGGAVAVKLTGSGAGGFLVALRDRS
jgi:mevalonate kinase